MRRAALSVAAGILLVFAVCFAATPGRAQIPFIPRLAVVVFGGTEAGDFVFSEGTTGEPQILVPSLPIIVNVTFHNNETTVGLIHTFTINDENGTIQLNTGDVDANGTATVEFTIESLDPPRVVVSNGPSFAPERGDRGILFYCIPHRPVGMVGEIVLASVAAEPQEKGFLLRAYWIGLIGIFATIVWIVISYFIIKSSSPRFQDHREHLRKGLP